MSQTIHIKGAREHNLKNLDVVLPRDQLVVVTGLSGSGKSSLSFDTIYAEGQRRYVESLSAYARQFLEQMGKPDVDSIEGLSPAISIEQKSTSHNPRSTVGTVTEIYDYLRLLFARVGRPFCVNCGQPITAQTVQQMVDAIGALPVGSKFQILAPIVRGRKGEYRKELADARRAGYVRARIDGDGRRAGRDDCAGQAAEAYDRDRRGPPGDEGRGVVATAARGFGGDGVEVDPGPGGGAGGDGRSHAVQRAIGVYHVWGELSGTGAARVFVQQPARRVSGMRRDRLRGLRVPGGTGVFRDLPLPGVPGHAPQGGEPGGEGGRQIHCRGHAVVHPRGRAVFRGSGVERAGAHDRPAHPEGDPGTAGVFAERGAGLSDAGPGGRDAVRRGGAAHPAGDADRVRAGGGVVYPG